MGRYTTNLYPNIRELLWYFSQNTKNTKVRFSYWWGSDEDIISMGLNGSEHSEKSKNTFEPHETEIFLVQNKSH